jgi:MFS family permease
MGRSGLTWRSCSARALRLFGYGFLSVTLVLYLIALGFAESSVGLLLSLALLGDVILSLWITTSADRLGRRKMLVVSALLIVFAGAVLASTKVLWLIGVAALVGVLSPSGYEVGPFLSIEQAALAQIVADRDRTRLFATIWSAPWPRRSVRCSAALWCRHS